MQSNQAECVEKHISRKSNPSASNRISNAKDHASIGLTLDDPSHVSNTHGVYKNPRLMHVCMTIVGSTVYLQTKDKSVWEGIFKTFDPKFTICLDFAVQVDPNLSTKDRFYQALKKGSQVREQAFFDVEEIVHIAVVDIDLSYATKDATLDKLTTDSDISGFNPAKPGKHRELEAWQDDEGDEDAEDSLLSLDEIASNIKNGGNKNNSRGWDPEKMFDYNARVHKVNSTYNDKLIDYTIALNETRQNSEEWQSKQRKAAAIAKEIESNPKSLSRLAKEDGSDDEEEKFSAVVRPEQPSSQEQSKQSVHQQSTQQPRQATHQQQQQQQQSQQQQTQPQSQHPHQSHHNREHPQHQQPQHHHPSPHQQPHHQPLQQHHAHPHHHQNPTQHSNPSQLNQRPMPGRLVSNNQGWHNKNLRPRYERPRLDSLKNFSKQLNLTPQPGHNSQQSPQQQQHQSHQAHPPSQIPSKSPHQSSVVHAQQAQSKEPSQTQVAGSPLATNQTNVQPNQQVQRQPSQQAQQQTPQQQQQQQSHHHQHHHNQQQQQQQPNLKQSPQSSAAAVSEVQPQPGPAAPTSSQQTTQASQTATSSQASQNPARSQSEIAKKSTLNPNAKEFKPEFKPRSPATMPSSQPNGAPLVAGAPAPIDPINSSPMTQTGHEQYYQQVPIFPHGLSPHQQQHHAQFMPNHAHMHFQNPIYYMPHTAVPPFGQPIYGINDMSAHAMQGRRHPEVEGFGPAYVIPTGQYRFETPPNSFPVQSSWRGDQDQGRVQVYRRYFN